MYINRETRRQALDLQANGCEHAYLVSSLQLTKEEAKAYINEVKPEQYAALAVIMDDVIDEVLKVDLASYQLELKENLSKWWYAQAKPFDKLRAGVLSIFRDSIDSLSATSKFQRAAQYTEVVGRLDKRRFNDLSDHLFAGADTAATNMTALLSELPNILTAHGTLPEDFGPDLPDIARRSVNLPWTLAMMSASQMAAARHLSGGEISYGHGRHKDKVNHQLFEVVYKDGRPFSVKYKDLAEEKLFESYAPYWDITDQSIGLKFKDVEPSRAETIGCPITMLPGKMTELWNWVIDGAESKRAFRVRGG